MDVRRVRRTLQEPIGFEFQESYAMANISDRKSIPQILVATWDAFRLVILADRAHPRRRRVERAAERRPCGRDSIHQGRSFRRGLPGAGQTGFKLLSETAAIWTLNADGDFDSKLGEWRDLFDPENETAVNLSKEIYLPHPSACEWDETRRDMLKNLDRSDPTAERIANVPESLDQLLAQKRENVQTPSDRTTFLQERWYIEVQLMDHSTGMLNLVTTNDGGPVPLSVVTQLPTEPPPEPSHVAPLTRVEVLFQLDPLDTGAEAFALTAPPGKLSGHRSVISTQKALGMPRPDERGSSREREDLTAGLWALRQQQEESLAVIDALLRKALPEEPAENNLLEVQIDQADEESSKEGNGKSLKKAIDLVFICAYFVEIGIRLTAWGRANFKDGWFLFDLMLVAMGFVGNIVEPILTSSNGGENGFAQILVVRSLRLLRLVRAIRMLHMFRTVWRLVYGLLTSGNAMLSTFFILVLTLYIFACLGVEFVTKDPLLATHPLTADIVDYNFSSLQRICSLSEQSSAMEHMGEGIKLIGEQIQFAGLTMLTLISFIHADSIKEVYEPIIIVRPAMIIFFVSVILTVSVSLMNLVTAVLVEGALQNAANDKELSRHDLRLKVKKFAPKIMEVFVEIDKDGSGTIDRDELSQIKLSELPFELSTEHVSSLEEPSPGWPKEATDLFDMLDVDGKGTLTSTEFADGLLQLLTMDMPIHTMKTFKLLQLGLPTIVHSEYLGIMTWTTESSWNNPEASGARSGLEGFKEALHALRTQQEQSLAAIEALLETCEAESTVATVALKPDQDFDNNEKEEESSPTPCIEYDAAKTLRFRCMGFIAQQMLAPRSRNVHVQNVHALSEQGSKFKDLITDDEEDAYNTKTLSGMCRYLVSKPQFDWAMGVIILLNSICIGIETQRTVQPDLFVDWPSEVLDMTFVVIYVIEICMRLLAFGCANFRDGWFLFDFALVGMGVVGNVVVPIMNVSETEGDSPIAKVLVVRSLRLLRLVRAIRMLHMFRTVWRLVYGLLTSWNAIISTFFILLLTLYIFACLGVEVITRDSTLAADPSTAWIVEDDPPSGCRTMLTLFSFVSADSISAVYMPIVIVRPEYIIYFVAVILTVSVALMNLVTAVLVEGALANAANDKELSRHDMKQKVKKFAPKVMQVFAEIDEDGSGTIDRSEVAKINLNELPIELSSEHELFDMLDVEGKGTLTQIEFADGLLNLLTPLGNDDGRASASDEELQAPAASLRSAGPNQRKVERLGACFEEAIRNEEHLLSDARPHMKRDRPRKIHWKEIRPPLLGVGPYQNTNRLFLVRFGGKVVSSKRVNSTEAAFLRAETHGPHGQTTRPGYTFVHPCRVPFQVNKTNNAENMRCFPLPPLNGRSRARVDCQADRSDTNAKGLGTDCFREAPAVIYVSTPEASVTAAENVWFVEAVDVIGGNYSSIGDRLGRGTLAGFEIVDMDVQVVYGSLASVPVDVGIAFSSRVDVPPNGQVMVVGPPDLQQFGCVNKRGTVKPGSLGTISSCRSAVNPPSVTITLNQTLPEGLHLVIVPGETPRQNPLAGLNTFDIFLRLRASVLAFWWTQLLQYDTYFTVTVPIEILDDVDIDVWGILIDFPKEPDYRLDTMEIQASTSFGEGLYLSSSRSPFQAKVGDNQLLVHLDKTKKLRTGLTLINLQITRPERLPMFNFWRIAMCGNQMGENGEGCTLGEPRTERGPAVICVFASGGFDPLEYSSPPQDLKTITGGAWRSKVSFLLGMACGAAMTLYFDHQGPQLLDLGSSNGTFVNGVRLRPGPLNAVLLQHGDVIRLGLAKWTFSFELPRKTRADAEPPRAGLRPGRASPPRGRAREDAKDGEKDANQEICDAMRSDRAKLPQAEPESFELAEALGALTSAAERLSAHAQLLGAKPELEPVEPLEPLERAKLQEEKVEEPPIAPPRLDRPTPVPARQAPGPAQIVPARPASRGHAPEERLRQEEQIEAERLENLEVIEKALVEETEAEFSQIQEASEKGLAAEELSSELLKELARLEQIKDRLAAEFSRCSQQLMDEKALYQENMARLNWSGSRAEHQPCKQPVMENGFALDAYHVPKCGAEGPVHGGTMPKASNEAGSLFTEVKKNAKLPGPDYYNKEGKPFGQKAPLGQFSRIARDDHNSKKNWPAVGQYETITPVCTPRTRGGIMAKSARGCLIYDQVERSGKSGAEPSYPGVQPNTLDKRWQTHRRKLEGRVLPSWSAS
eukprot:g23484.t1